MVCYSFYLEPYNGAAISADDWPIYEARAAAHLARYKRIYTVISPKRDAEKMAVCAMAEALQSFDLIANGEGGAVQSASIGSVSVSYGSGNKMDISPKGQSKELYRCACLYLDIYRG